MTVASFVTCQEDKLRQGEQVTFRTKLIGVAEGAIILLDMNVPEAMVRLLP